MALLHGLNSSVNDGRTDGWMDGQTDIPSYRDVRTHLNFFKDHHFCLLYYVNWVTLETVKTVYYSPFSGAHIHFHKQKCMHMQAQVSLDLFEIVSATIGFFRIDIRAKR